MEVNNKMKIFGNLAIISLLLMGCNAKKAKPIVIERPALIEIDTSYIAYSSRSQLNRTDYFLVKNSDNSIDSVNKFISHFVKNHGLDSIVHYDNYSMLFYKETGDLNEKNISKWPFKLRYKEFIHNENEFISEYLFSNGVLYHTDMAVHK